MFLCRLLVSSSHLFSFNSPINSNIKLRKYTKIAELITIEFIFADFTALLNPGQLVIIL